MVVPLAAWKSRRPSCRSERLAIGAGASVTGAGISLILPAIVPAIRRSCQQAARLTAAACEPYLRGGGAVRTPVTILSGFLGSGKTTRLNALLRAPHGRRLAVVLNELGAIGVDASRLSGAEEFVELEGGCVCCALNVEFSKTLERLAARGGIDHVVVETTGIADPLSAAWTVDRPGLRESFRLDAIVTVVDALNLEAALAAHPEATLQIERADLVLLSKLDAAPGAEAALIERVRALNPAARIVPSAPGDVPSELLLDAAGAGVVPGKAAALHTAHDTHQIWQTWEYRTTATL